ncbi:SIP1 domain-containing protein [Skeletonema marinoi]|uniref:SIP1 domain-containing protein n=1 Tax=Skeletonema marinoi TaxID=267567 RepID=A0AAD8Y127_9STRA|nr:SIP1 domain-containing protein [Skeletonema marinoi]
MDAKHIEQDAVEASAEINSDFCGELIDLSTEAIAEDAEMLENIAYDTTLNKRPLNESVGDTSGSHHVRKKKKTNNNRKSNKKESKYDSTKLNDATTIEDLNTIDASAYLAWVNSQAGSLPSVFVAETQTDDNNNDTSDDKKNTDTATTAERKDDPIDGSAATLQILLSKQMDIMPPPSNRHIPPACNAATFHINGESPVNTAASETQNDTNNNTCSNWVSTTISSFSKLRSYLETQDALQKQNNDDTQLIRKVAVPKMKDRTGWHVFCLGREEAFGNQGGYFEEIDSENEQSKEESCKDKHDNVSDEVQPNNDAAEKETNISTYNPDNVPSDGHKPTSSLLLQIDQVLTRVLFHHHVYFLCEWKFPLTHQRAAWIYALLARMNKPWHRDECCAVRKVLRECCSRRWELSLPQEGDGSTVENDRKWEQLAMLNTLIAITGIYYEQGSNAGGDGMDLLFKTSSS